MIDLQSLRLKKLSDRCLKRNYLVDGSPIVVRHDHDGLQARECQLDEHGRLSIAVAPPGSHPGTPPVPGADREGPGATGPPRDRDLRRRISGDASRTDRGKWKPDPPTQTEEAPPSSWRDDEIRAVDRDVRQTPTTVTAAHADAASRMCSPAIVRSSRNEMRATKSPASKASGVFVIVMSAALEATVSPRDS